MAEHQIWSKWVTLWSKLREPDDGNLRLSINIYMTNAINKFISFTAEVPGYDSLWILGDKFVKETFNTAVRVNNEIQYYSKDNYDIHYYATDTT